jgi:DNA-binding NtrC family response regulator
MRKTLVVVDDDELVVAGLRLILPKDWSLQEISYKDLNNPILSKAQVLLSDMHLTQNKQAQPQGIQVIQFCRSRYPQLECIAMSGDLSVELMENGLRAGAQYFLPKPIIKEELHLILSRISSYLDLRLRQSEAHFKSPWIGSGPKSEEVLKAISRVQELPGHILIEGESGTGKEVVANLIAKQNPQLPFLSVNISAIPNALFESEMFGHLKGSFTGADQNRPGLIEASQNGLLFLDEMEALDSHNQVKLLRFLETGEGRRIGAKETYTSNARVIAATNIPLEELVAQGKFRSDLMFRLNQNKIQLPSLRERTEDLPELSSYFLNRLKPKINKSLSPQALHILQNYHFPGNIRELKRILEQAAYSAPLPVIRPEDIKPLLLSSNVNGLNLTSNADNFDDSLSLEENLQKVEKEFIERAIQRYSDLETVWQSLKISRSSLYKKMKNYGIPTP